MMTFKDKVFKKLFELPVNEMSMANRLKLEADRMLTRMSGRDLPSVLPAPAYDLEKKVSPDRKGEFLQAVKEFISLDYGKAFGFYLEFNNNYTTLIKKEY